MKYYPIRDNFLFVYFNDRNYKILDIVENK